MSLNTFEQVPVSGQKRVLPMTRDVASADRLDFDGPLTMRAAETLCATLRTALEASTVVAIDCNAATDVDLSFIQLLLSARLSAGQQSRTLALASRPAGVLLDTLTRAGFRVVDEATGSFWFESATA